MQKHGKLEQTHKKLLLFKFKIIKTLFSVHIGIDWEETKTI